MIEFVTGGWRARIGEDFNKNNVEKITCVISYLSKKIPGKIKPVVVGYDNRFLSKEASMWVCNTLAYFNVPVQVFPRSIATPILMHKVKHNDLNFGIMITASHNPYIYNGIKIITKEGRDASKELTDEISKRCNDSNNIYIEPSLIDTKLITVLDEAACLEDYTQDVSSLISAINPDLFFLFNPKKSLIN